MTLFTPLRLRTVEIPNRVVVSPMSQYRAQNGYANDWHLVHLGRFALGGAGLVFCEATAVEARGRRTHGDLGLWCDSQVPPLARVTQFLAREGAVPGIQLAHAGRKASERRPWHGETPVDAEDLDTRGEAPWEAIAPSPLPYADGWPAPSAMSVQDIADVLQAFRDAATRALAAGFQVIEVYAAHGFLVHQFCSPLANRRADTYGGDFPRRVRFAREVARAIRETWPAELPLMFRLSITDWHPDGWQLDDTVALARLLRKDGVDAIDCSSGGISGRERPQGMVLAHGYQLELARRVREGADIPTIGVGFLWDPVRMEAALQGGQADLLAIARELLDDPNWPLHAARSLGVDAAHARWKPEFGWWLEKRARARRKLGLD
ncbi:MAG: NADH:flavin oxidoreductase/NADH oxidase [Gammaproteobacteria bacterium]